MRKKIRELQQILRKKRIDAALFINFGLSKIDPAITYFSGITLEYCCLAIPKNKSPFLVVPGFEADRARKSVKGNIKVVQPSEKKGFIKEVKERLKTKKDGIIGINPCFFSIAEAKKLKGAFKGARLKDISKHLHSIRSIKTADELRVIRKSCAIASEILENCFANFKKFKTERDAANFLKIKTFEAGCELAFDPIVAAGKNASFPHHIPQKTRLKGGFGIIDFGVKYMGYCSDVTRSFYVGKPSKKELNLYTFVLNTQENVIRGLRVGKKMSRVMKDAENILGKNFTHGLGHGIGIEIHEQPNLTHSSKDIIQNNQVFTIEPGYYIRNRLGIRIEDDILISEGKPVILTKIPKKLRIFAKK